MTTGTVCQSLCQFHLCPHHHKVSFCLFFFFFFISFSFFFPNSAARTCMCAGHAGPCPHCCLNTSAHDGQLPLPWTASAWAIAMAPCHHAVAILGLTAYDRTAPRHTRLASGYVPCLTPQGPVLMLPRSMAWFSAMSPQCKTTLWSHIATPRHTPPCPLGIPTHHDVMSTPLRPCKSPLPSCRHACAPPAYLLQSVGRSVRHGRWWVCPECQQQNVEFCHAITKQVQWSKG
jgi:hypothetical protein